MAVFIKGIVFFGVVIASAILVNVVKNHALKKGILDIPNIRSSHKVATPRGGGLGFVIPFLFSIIILGFLDILSESISLALVGGGIIVAVLGWLDDKNGLTARVRAFFQFLAAIWAVFWLGGFPGLDLGFVNVHLLWFGSLLVVIGMVWMINLYNFMDGIDGIAGIEAISIAGAAGVLLFWNSNTGLVFVCGLLACSVAGFLIWNWPPAKIFMGDVGSGFLGFIFAVLAIASENSGALPLLVWLILLGVFIVDATATLIRRVLKGERWYEAHRTHVYQLAVQAGYSHKQVTLTVLGVNIALAAIAWLAVLFHDLLLVITLLTFGILFFVQAVLQHKFDNLLKEQSKLRLSDTNQDMGTETFQQVASAYENDTNDNI
jgi:Fuc2NAc and GlcNAc transferase